MRNITTARLTIHETDSDTVKPISEKNQAIGSSNLFSALSDNEEWFVFANKDALCALLSKLLSYEGNGEQLVYGIWLESTLIGYIGLKNHTAPIPEIQIEFDPEYQHQGYGYEALSKMIDHFFVVGHKCLRYLVKPSNKASIALVEKVGGQLQPPDSEVERILLRTYLIHSP
jgi:RimJ/RimL family protein N-acetyltransferase